jgi:TonB family protein
MVILSRMVFALALICTLVRGSAQDTKPLSYKSLTYPPIARLARYSGTVTLGFTVDSDGKTASIEIISGHPILSAAAKENLSTWRFAAPTGAVSVDPRRATFVFEFSDDSADGYYNPEKERFVFEGPSLVRVRAAPSGTLSANDCPDGPIATPSEAILATDSVTLSRSGCYGTCPSYEVTLYGNGRVRWKGDGFVEAVGERNYQIEPTIAEKVLHRFRSPEVLGLCGDYSQSVTDSASSMTAIAVSNARKTIHDYASSSPVWFRQLQTELDSAAQTHSMRHGDPVTEPLIYIQGEYLPKPGMTDLMRSAARGDLANLKNLIKAGARLEETDASGWTALMYAAASYYSGQTLDELVLAGANRNHRSPFGDTVLMASALNGYFDEDLAKGAETLNAQNRDGVTALMLLAASGRVDEIRAALKAGANAKLKDKQGRSAVDYLDAIPCHKSLVRGDKQFMEITGPCSDLGKDLRKARSLILSAARAK